MFNAANTEHIALYAKLRPFLAEIRATTKYPDYLASVEHVVSALPDADERIAIFERYLTRQRNARVRGRTAGDVCGYRAATPESHTPRVARMPTAFLRAEWRHLAMLNYRVRASLLEPFVPAGADLDMFRGVAYLSVVGFSVSSHARFGFLFRSTKTSRKSICGFTFGAPSPVKFAAV